ncbi:MAG TPA: hypothetical protein VK435_07195, partial [Thermodesulfovibrionales bacterium]|nr:hypothetical protein [Thermodesulfovibrionales bacterium]
MKKPGSIIRLICAVLAIPILAAILPVTAFADQGIVIMLKNTGPLPITGASLGFDVKPIDSWQTLEVTVGDGLGASNIGDFQVGVMPVSLDNPLPPGGTACVGPLSQLAPGDYVDIEAVDSYGNGFFSAVPPFREIMPRATV